MHRRLLILYSIWNSPNLELIYKWHR